MPRRHGRQGRGATERGAEQGSAGSRRVAGRARPLAPHTQLPVCVVPRGVYL